MFFLRIGGPAENETPISNMSKARPDLLAREAVSAVNRDRSRLHGSKITPGTRFGKSLTPDVIA
jgi:hypothetical protein